MLRLSTRRDPARDVCATSIRTVTPRSMRRRSAPSRASWHLWPAQTDQDPTRLEPCCTLCAAAKIGFTLTSSSSALDRLPASSAADAYPVPQMCPRTPRLAPVEQPTRPRLWDFFTRSHILCSAFALRCLVDVIMD